MTEYLITFNDEWVPPHTSEQIREKRAASLAVMEEMQPRASWSSATVGSTGPPRCAVSSRSTASPCSPTARTSRRRSTSAASPSWTCPTTRRPDTGPAGSRPRSTGRRRCTGSAVPGRPGGTGLEASEHGAQVSTWPGRLPSRERKRAARAGDHPCPPRGVGAGGRRPRAPLRRPRRRRGRDCRGVRWRPRSGGRARAYPPIPAVGSPPPRPARRSIGSAASRGATPSTRRPASCTTTPLPSRPARSRTTGSDWSSPAATLRSRWRPGWRSPCACSAASPSPRSPAPSWCRRPRWRGGSPAPRQRSRRRTSPTGCPRPPTSANGSPACSRSSTSSSTRATSPARETTRCAPTSPTRRSASAACSATLLPDDGEVAGLLALMLLTDARRPARVSRTGELVTLDEQDRGAWDRTLIAEGNALIRERIDGGGGRR